MISNQLPSMSINHHLPSTLSKVLVGNIFHFTFLLKTWRNDLTQFLLHPLQVWSTFLYPELVQSCLEALLKKLQLSYVDLYLIHFPVSLKVGTFFLTSVINIKINIKSIWLQRDDKVCKDKTCTQLFLSVYLFLSLSLSLKLFPYQFTSPASEW